MCYDCAVVSRVCADRLETLLDRECSTQDVVYGLTTPIVIQEHSHVHSADFFRQVHWCESLSCREDGRSSFDVSGRGAFVVAAVVYRRVSPESFEKRLSAALNRVGCSMLGAVIEVLDASRDRLVLDGSLYHCAGRSRGKILSSFGEVSYERSQYRRRGCEAVFRADARFGVIGGFWSPYAARLGS